MKRCIIMALLFCSITLVAFADVIVPEYVYIPDESECEDYDYWQSIETIPAINFEEEPFIAYDYSSNNLRGLYGVQYYLRGDDSSATLLYTLTKRDSPYGKEGDLSLEYDAGGLFSIGLSIDGLIPEEAVGNAMQFYWKNGQYAKVRFSLSEYYHGQRTSMIIEFDAKENYGVKIWDTFNPEIPFSLVEVKNPDKELMKIVEKYRKYLNYISMEPLAIKQEGTMFLYNVQDFVNRY